MYFGFQNKDYGIWGSVLGFPYFGKLPNMIRSFRPRVRTVDRRL